MIQLILSWGLLFAMETLKGQTFEVLKPGPPLPLDPSVLWSDGHTILRHSPTDAKPRLGFAVLTAKINDRAGLPLLLKNSVRTALAGRDDLSRLAVPINQIEQLSGLARLAHESTGLCGSIEFVPLLSNLNPVIKPAAPIYNSRVIFSELQSLLGKIEVEPINQYIQQISSLPSRYFLHPEGEKAHNSIRQLWEAQLKTGRWTLSERSQSMSEQKSVVARLEGTKKPEETIIIGAHLDSIVNRSGNSKTDPAPGADDDASGIAVLTEVLRQIELGAIQLDRSLELQAYAAEEVGLIGSKELASSYAKDDRKIVGMFQVDMASYSTADAQGVIHLLEEYSSRDLRRSAIDWIRHYMGAVYKIGHMPSGSASDHKSFWEQGYPTLFPFEDPLHYNPHIHTGLDTTDKFDEGLLIKRITQLALLFAAYQGGMSSLQESYASQATQAALPLELSKDLPIAIQKKLDDYYFAVAAPSSTHTVEFCIIDDAKGEHCALERETLNKNASLGPKKIFYSSNTWALSAGQNWRIFAYDQNDELLAWRQLRLGAL